MASYTNLSRAVNGGRASLLSIQIGTCFRRFAFDNVTMLETKKNTALSCLTWLLPGFAETAHVVTRSFRHRFTSRTIEVAGEEFRMKWDDMFVYTDGGNNPVNAFGA